jgi:hypothetical protein
MLLELLNHHEDLFMAAVGPLIGARNAADLARLAASCRQLNSFIATIDFYKHSKLFNNSLKFIKSINILSNKYCSIKEYNNKLHIYTYEQGGYSCEQKYSVWTSNEYGEQNSYVSMFIYHGTKVRTIYSVSILPCFNINIIGPIPEWLQKYIRNNSVCVMRMIEFFTFYT